MDSVYAAIDEFNSFQPVGKTLNKDPETVLLGGNGLLDSLGLVSFLVTVEQRISDDFQTPVTLASEKAFSQRNSPFANIRSLTAFISGLLEETANG